MNETLDFSKQWNNSDQILVVADRELHVHRCLLSLWSPVFDRMFNSNFKEKDSRKVELKGKKLEEIEGLLRVMYDRRTKIKDASVHYLLRLSDEYQITQLRNECIKFLENAEKTGIKAIVYLATAERFDIDSVREQCIQELACVPNSVLDEEKIYQEQTDQVKSLILTARVKRLESEEDKLKSTVTSLTKYLYRRANEDYVEFLREQGLEETVLSRCADREDHVKALAGQHFDVNCRTCRKNVTVTKKFNVETKVMSLYMNEMYLMISNKEKEDCIRTNKTTSKITKTGNTKTN